MKMWMITITETNDDKFRVYSGISENAHGAMGYAMALARKGGYKDPYPKRVDDMGEIEFGLAREQQ